MATHNPTVGFNVLTVTRHNTEMTLWDVGGGCKIRGLWPNYYTFTRGSIFVLDSMDRDRLQSDDPTNETNTQLYLDTLTRDPALANVPLLILCNKQDVDGAMSVEELTNTLGLHRITDRPWHVQGVSAVTGVGLEEGLEWIRRQLVPHG